MSELNDDLLNYEIGEVEDTDLTGADEDELLLSDDEDDLLSDNRSESKHHKPPAIDDTRIDTAKAKQCQSDDNALQQSSSSSDKRRTNASESKTVKQSNVLSSVDRPATSVQCAPSDASSEQECSINEVVSSTNKEDEENLSQSNSQASAAAATATSSQSSEKSQENDPYICLEPNIESTVCDDSDKSYSESNDNKSTDPAASQESTEDGYDNSFMSDGTDFDADDSDDVHVRRNAKTCVEREMPQPLDEHGNNNARPKGAFGRNRPPRPQMIRGNHPYAMQAGGDNFNPAFMQFRGQMRRPMAPGPPPGEFMRNHAISMMRPPHGMQRMPMQMHPSRMPPGVIGPPNQRLQRPPFQPLPGMMYGNNPAMPPGMMRPRIPPPNAHMMGQGPPFHQVPPFSQQNNPANLRQPMRPNAPLPATGMNPAGPPNQPPIQLPPLVPRKVLINPNFKGGGVQGATNQLMMDTMKNSQLLENSREAELLRQQEAFINQNRLHIEKRRRSREYSPSERERSYSPPVRRRDNTRKPYFRENRVRRAGSRDRDREIDAKRQRNDGDPEKNKDSKTEEDEETRAYRLEIEKQKAMREKILRDKEMRRRRAAEELSKKDDEKKPSDEPLQKFTPIVVTEKKIISLKKKAPADGAPQTDAKTTASNSAERPVSQRQKTYVRIDGVDIDEDELLADEDDAPPPPKSKQAIAHKITASETPEKKPTAPLFANRRVVVRNAATDASTNNDKATTTGSSTTASGKGIFDRLDKKVISVNEAAKRKIQRIVISSSD